MAINLYTPQEVQITLASRMKEARLRQKLTQEGLAKRAGMSLGSLKRFEATGKISLESLLKIALVLGYLAEFQALMIQEKSYQSLDEIIRSKKTPLRGSRE